MRIRTLLIAMLAATAVQAADKQPDSSIDVKAAFARLKTLAGEWQGNTSMGKAHLRYEVIAGGASLVEHESGENMPAMLTVYHLDGNRLMLTHYCMAGNQPRMVARSFDPKTGELGFEFLDATNLASGAGHMHSATIRVADGDHFTAAWEFFEGGRRKNTENVQYTRVR